MFLSSLALLTAFIGLTDAHFQLLQPLPRGPFVADIETQYCGGHPITTTNRTQFPISGGYFTIKTGHPGFTVGATIATIQNPTSFDNFTRDGQQQLVSPFAKEEKAGTFCIPLNITAANIPGAVNGANVTIQIVFAGGDGNLYQCADLTLSNTTTLAADQCTNTTVATDAHNDKPSGASSNKQILFTAGVTTTLLTTVTLFL